MRFYASFRRHFIILDFIKNTNSGSKSANYVCVKILTSVGQATVTNT